MSRHARAIPADFVARAATSTSDDLSVIYSAGLTMIARWRKASGISGNRQPRNSSQMDGREVVFNDSAEQRTRYGDAQRSSDALTRAQLRTGQHLLDLPVARALGAKLGMDPAHVRSAFSTTTTSEGPAA